MSQHINRERIHPSTGGSFVPARRSRWPFLVVLAVLSVVVFSGQTWLSYYVDALWFGSLGYREVFLKTLGLEWTVFTVFAAATFLILYGAILALKRTHRDDLPAGQTIFVGGQALRLPVEPILRFAAIAGSLLVALGTGAYMMGEWPTLALFWYAPNANGGVADPVFGRPLTFYLLKLPAWQLISGWLTILSLIVCVVAAFLFVVANSTRALEGFRRGYNALPWRGLSISIAFLLLVIALQVYIGRFARLFQDHTIFGGASYTDVHIILPGLLVVCAALVLGAGIAGVNAASVQRARWLIAAIVPAAACYLLLQVVGWYVSNFIVKPNQLVREKPYIAYNIQMTRLAYGLDRMTQRKFPAETSVEAADPANNQATLQNIRLWDWRALQDTLRQIQEIRTYYDFPDIDIDRYEIEGHLREVMLAARELNVDKLPESSRNWINEKLIYTHGYGITMNTVNGFTTEGLPNLLLSNMPVESTVPGLTVTRPEIYFGELTNTDVYVKTRQQEFNYPQGQTNSFTSYEGSGGIILDGFLRRILIALDRGDVTKLPFSDDVNENSRLLMRRNVRARVSALAPFLTFDQDPYIVVAQHGRLYWMMDAFTNSDSYPYSSHYLLDGTSINYMRNSVKAVIDAYNGTTTFYVFDDEEPIIAGYRRVFPALFKDASAMPPDLRKHVRYPEMLLNVQAQAYGLYHMTDPEVFYNREDLWTVATEIGMNDAGEQTTQAMQPNFVLMRLPGEADAEFVEILPFTPANRNNLIGWIAGRSDGAQYGNSIVYDFPKTKLVDGPLQVEARIDQNAQLSGQLTLWSQHGSHVRRGNMLVIPIGRTLLYAEPIYLQAERSPMPELRLVVLALQDRLAYGPTFQSAMSALFGGAASSTSAVAESEEPARTASASAAASGAAPDLKALIAQAAKDLSDYQRLTAEGKLGEAGQKLEQLKRTLELLNKSPK
ncbi:MAG TPA: UPF0182 family protein [Candidatus Acidoferrum sp.]|nr:UPF0182 family protein [Candidatus Acidoferrum sp.]